MHCKINEINCSKESTFFKIFLVRLIEIVRFTRIGLGQIGCMGQNTESFGPMSARRNVLSVATSRHRVSEGNVARLIRRMYEMESGIRLIWWVFFRFYDGVVRRVVVQKEAVVPEWCQTPGSRRHVQHTSDALGQITHVCRKFITYKKKRILIIRTNLLYVDR